LRTRVKPSANLQRRYSYLEKAFDGGNSHCLACRLDRKICEADQRMQEASVHKPTEAVPLRAAADGLGALRFRLVLAMIVSYLAMMAFLIHSARHATQTAGAAADFSPSMIAVASCMAFSVVLTGLFVFARHGD
jgi:hypothetical protein